ncbi:MAG: hypothetical protein ABIH08_06145 [Candidatus Omnitrophota bacterium]
MIRVSLEGKRISILNRRKTYYTLSSIMPLIFKINKAMSLLNKKHNVVCNISVKIGNTINLEVTNA